ncbi:NAD(P)H-dependent oxidoreductase [Vibrio brasiliensis]|uniref:General stress protein 14 n=1 Tax=Vibrio brasiliensis LMG 20546 TaxID=945543 RepID=E8LTY3_9VIBR|nr:NAD(P)H-dependent oxidoreductase [Vibrio brasiliensis]EGA65819.1 general stress protein 14 [Vibrio brasiliensis LMG 20546]MCG9647871.1 NAD(P)H-dependent oxidoreductase [Vibrio brasiliensis]MCG9726666.1 NAD(P)H-dependent oxidoreductase [Vibrio brasiliensis]MCG9752576.1 NAD(P)H-dependent oxidoreductase [Vibrio brasiliensis]MCG9781913.1 NAD(P)H-dependent oxidoreductase [Vibrio brasiliensis]
MPEKRVLVLYAHPSPHRSEVNQQLIRAAKQVEGVTVVDLYHDYPTYQINIDLEQQRLLEHDVIIFQFPLYWYSTPAMLKEWQDLVLEYGFAYGQEGTALHGKVFFCSLSAGGKAEAYQTDGYNHFTIREILHPLEQMAKMTGMQYLAPLSLFSARTARDDGRVASHVQKWRWLLQQLVADNIDYDQASTLAKLNHYPALQTIEDDA